MIKISLAEMTVDAFPGQALNQVTLYSQAERELDLGIVAKFRKKKYIYIYIISIIEIFWLNLWTTLNWVLL